MGDDELSVSQVVRIVVVAVVVIIAIVGGVWLFRVVTAQVKGTGDATITKYSEQNWVPAQRQFHQNINDIDGFKTKIQNKAAELAAYVKAHPTSNGTPYDPNAEYANNLRSDLSGLSAQCTNTVSSYNTDVEGFLTAGFRDPGLPDHIDPAVCNPPAGTP